MDRLTGSWNKDSNLTGSAKELLTRRASPIKTRYDITHEGVVKLIVWTSGSDVCRASLNKDGDTYTYETLLADDENAVVCPTPMSLANCILAANVNLGLIPPHNFDPIACPNKH